MERILKCAITNTCEGLNIEKLNKNLSEVNSTGKLPLILKMMQWAKDALYSHDPSKSEIKVSVLVFENPTVFCVRYKA